MTIQKTSPQILAFNGISTHNPNEPYNLLFPDPFPLPYSLISRRYKILAKEITHKPSRIKMEQAGPAAML
jgi:hypothetical protein